MTSMEDSIEAPAVLKTEQKGRVRTPAHRREAIVDEFERSGMSGLAFAKQYGIKYPTLASWVQRRQRERTGSEQKRSKREGSPLRFLEATIASAESPPLDGWIELESPEGFKVRLQHRGQIALAVECLKTLKRC